MAGRRECRRQPRAGLRGGIGGIGALGRRPQRGLGRVRRSRGAAASARPRHGGALRVRKPRRRLAPRPHLRRGGRARHRVGSGSGARAEPRGTRVDARAGPRSPRPRVALDPALGHAARRGAGASPARDRELRADASATGRSAGTARRGRASRRASSSSRRVASSTTPTGAPTTSRTTRRARESRSSSFRTRRRTTTAAS